MSTLVTGKVVDPELSIIAIFISDIIVSKRSIAIDLLFVDESCVMILNRRGIYVLISTTVGSVYVHGVLLDILTILLENI